MLVKNLTKYKLLPFIVALAIAIIVPLVVEAQADETKLEESVVVSQATDDSEQPIVTQAPASEVTDPVPVPSDEEQPVLPEEEVPVEEPIDEPVDTPADEDPITDITESFDRYIAFAQAEHPGVEIASVKFVWKHGVKSAKVTFVDGWKVFIGVSDGSTLKIADEDGEVKKCQPRVSRKKAFKRWYKTHNSYYEWWKSKQPVEEPSEEESVYKSSTQEASAEASTTTKVRGTKSKTYHTSDYKKSYRW